jgi:hypothetical protein
MSDSRDWHFTVWAKDRLLDEVTVPHHQMGRPAAEAFVKHLAVSSCGYPAQTVASYYMNRRKGPVQRQSRFDPDWHTDPERKVVQLFCGDCEHYAKCEFPLGDEVAAFLKYNRDLNLRGTGQ